MSVGEMIITLDDLSCLLHLPMTRRPLDHMPSFFVREAVKTLLMTHLGIPTETEAFMVANASAMVRLAWLEDLYHRYIESGS